MTPPSTPKKPLPIPTGGHHDALVAALSELLRSLPEPSDDFSMAFDSEIDKELAEWDQILHPRKDTAA